MTPNEEAMEAWKQQTWAKVRATVEECFAAVDAGKIIPRSALIVILSEKTDDEANSRVCIAGLMDASDRKGRLAMKGVVIRSTQVLQMMTEQIALEDVRADAGPPD